MANGSFSSNSSIDIKSTSSHSRMDSRIEDSINLLESQDLATATEIQQIISENLSTDVSVISALRCEGICRQPLLVSGLVDHFFDVHSEKTIELLVGVREPLDKVLIEKLQEGLRIQKTRLPAMQLLLHIVYHQPPWTHCLLDRQGFFQNLIRSLKNEADMLVLHTGVTVLITLLPTVPVRVGCHLSDIFHVLACVADLINKKFINIPDNFMLHLRVVVYTLFLRLYGMFPCSLLHYLQSHYTKKENFLVFDEIIAPMLDMVRFHSGLITWKKETETTRTRWRKVEPQDIIINCAKLSMDLTENPCDPYRSTSFLWPSRDQGVPVASFDDRRKFQGWWEEQTAKMDDRSAPVYPEMLNVNIPLRLNTPQASASTTPICGAFDPNSSLQLDSAGTVAPDNTQMPTPSAEVTVSDTMEDGDLSFSSKVTPVSCKVTPISTHFGTKMALCSSNRAERKRAFTSPFFTRLSSTFQPIADEPLSSKSASASACTIPPAESSAVRALHFSSGGAEPDGEQLPETCFLGSRCKPRGEVELSAPVLLDSAPTSVGSCRGSENDHFDQEVCKITHHSRSAAHVALPSLETTSLENVSEKVVMTKVSSPSFKFNSHNASGHVSLSRWRSWPQLNWNSSSHAPQGGSTAGLLDPSSSMFMSACSPMPAGVCGKSRSQWRFPAIDNLSQLPCCQHPHPKASDVLEACSPSAGCQANGINTPFAKRPCFPHETRRGSVDIGTADALRWGYMASAILAPVQVGICSQCHQWLAKGVPPREGSVSGSSTTAGVDIPWIRLDGSEAPAYRSMAPMEVLDRHLLFGCEMHSMLPVDLSLASLQSVSWTHFGGSPPADEIDILRGEVCMAHNQLMYERHKRDNHAVRNRRLLRRVANAITLEETVQALTQRLLVQKADIQNLEVSLKLLQDRNHQLEKSNAGLDNEKITDYRATKQRNTDLEEANQELKNLLLTQKAENDHLRLELCRQQGECFEMTRDNEMLAKDLLSLQSCRNQVQQLQKEMLLMGEAQDRLQNHLQQHRQHCNDNSRMMSDVVSASLQAEVKELKKKKTCLQVSNDATICRLVELEGAVKQRDTCLSDMKQRLSMVTASSAAYQQVSGEKYRSLLHINQRLEDRVQMLDYEVEDLNARLQRRREERVSEESRSPAVPDSTQSGIAGPAEGSEDRASGGVQADEGLFILDEEQRAMRQISDLSKDRGGDILSPPSCVSRYGLLFGDSSAPDAE